MKIHYLKIGDLYIQVNEKVFFSMVDTVSKDYKIVKKTVETDLDFVNFLVFYAVDDELPFSEYEEIGFVRNNEEGVYE